MSDLRAECGVLLTSDKITQSKHVGTFNANRSRQPRLPLHLKEDREGLFFYAGRWVARTSFFASCGFFAESGGLLPKELCSCRQNPQTRYLFSGHLVGSIMCHCEGKKPKQSSLCRFKKVGSWWTKKVRYVRFW